MIRIMLSARCGENRVSQAELARMTGIRRNTIGDYYNDFAERISLDHLDRICHASGAVSICGTCSIKSPGWHCSHSHMLSIVAQDGSSPFLSFDSIC